MPVPNAIVDRVDKIEPSQEEAVLANLDRKLIIAFAEGQTARLNLDDPQSTAYASILENLRDHGKPVYVELDPSSQTIVRLLLPMKVRVKAVVPTESDDLEVELEISHAVHVLKRDNPFFQELLGELQKAQAEGVPVLVTETRDEHAIIDVRRLPGPFVPHHPGEPQESPTLDFTTLRAVSANRAQELFDLVNAERCDALGQPASCIPFLYPDSGCEGRAHAMYRLIQGAGEEAGKVWSHGTLRASTPNHPCCRVAWGWHVAPVISVEVTTGQPPEPWVIDPALFDGPVHVSKWVGVQGDPHLRRFCTPGRVFYRNSVVSFDPLGKDTEDVLLENRSNLKSRSTDPKAGPPPYTHC